MDQPQGVRRQFTRDQVEQWYLKALRCSTASYEVTEVSLLPGITPPAWLIAHKVTIGENCYPGQSIVYQKHDHDDIYLYFCVEKELPVGMATPDDEDAAIRLRDAEKYAEYLGKAE